MSLNYESFLVEIYFEFVGAVYALFGANIAHFVLNWRDDTIIFRRSKHGAALVPISKRYARWGRTIRVTVLSLWLITELGYAFYDKIARCRWNINGINDLENDFDKDQCRLSPNSTVHEEKIHRWWCYTRTCYSAHFYGFFAGKWIY